MSPRIWPSTPGKDQLLSKETAKGMMLTASLVLTLLSMYALLKDIHPFFKFQSLREITQLHLSELNICVLLSLSLKDLRLHKGYTRGRLF